MQAGDRSAFGELIEQFQPTVYAICLRRLGNASEALELTQDVFLHVMRRINQLRDPERFAGWLRQVAARMAINHATRRSAPRSVEVEVLEGREPAGGRPARRADQPRAAPAGSGKALAGSSRSTARRWSPSTSRSSRCSRWRSGSRRPSAPSNAGSTSRGNGSRTPSRKTPTEESGMSRVRTK